MGTPATEPGRENAPVQSIFCLIRYTVYMKFIPNPIELALGRTERPNQGPPRHRPGQMFLKGPVPQPWLSRASTLPGKSLHIGIAIWFLAGIARSRTIRLSGRVTTAFGADRHAKYRALRWLENARLITVSRRPGCSPRITLLDVPDD